MTPQTRIRHLKEQFQAELAAETDKVKRRELARAINGLFYVICKGES